MPFTSEVNICNLALRYIGGEPIVSLDDPNHAKESEVCELLYPAARNSILARHPWKFALTRQSLSQATGDNDTSYLYRYQLPVDPPILRILGFVEQDALGWERMLDCPFIVEGDKIYTDVENAMLRYVAEEEDVTKFDDLFGFAVARRLAADIAPAFGVYSQTLEQLAEAAYREAVSQNATARKLRRSGRNWLAARS